MATIIDVVDKGESEILFGLLETLGDIMFRFKRTAKFFSSCTNNNFFSARIAHIKLYASFFLLEKKTVISILKIYTCIVLMTF